MIIDYFNIAATANSDSLRCPFQKQPQSYHQIYDIQYVWTYSSPSLEGVILIGVSRPSSILNTV